MNKKIIILILFVLLLCGCSKEKRIDKDNSGGYYTYCDKNYGVEYIQFFGGNRAGMSVRLDENGNVIHCNRN